MIDHENFFMHFWIVERGRENFGTTKKSNSIIAWFLPLLILPEISRLIFFKKIQVYYLAILSTVTHYDGWEEERFFFGLGDRCRYGTSVVFWVVFRGPAPCSCFFLSFLISFSNSKVISEKNIVFQRTVFQNTIARVGWRSGWVEIVFIKWLTISAWGACEKIFLC